ncbi:transmembrane protein 131 isoform X1 [Cydia pomonella]|uniref:transmembrane protein 131 isoform X1 n=1 Tax=Cydia pomonella TaxID=82600 RepID=UPI002ADDC28C|nr:transmembrane protein 131 isoform X1 [Cydia pomonella]
MVFWSRLGEWKRSVTPQAAGARRAPRPAPPALGVTVHDSLVEGITFQEWGSETGAGAGAGSGRALPPAALRASPPALALGRAALGAAHAATVTLTNTANTTMHLASIAGTTPDFHASFFDSKTLACGANTSFSVVFLGRREGPVSQHLYIHTSLGVLKYPVSAIGVASDWALWPLVGVRVPHNATLRPLLHMHNPTDHPVQVMEMYSSASWLGLQLPAGGASAPREHWALPPHSTRALVRLRLRLPGKDTTAYIRIKANVTGAPLVVVVEAAAAAAGAHAEPLQLRAGTRGARDDPYTFSISLGNSAGSAAAVAGGAAGSCSGAPHAPPAPADTPLVANGHHNGTSL